MSIPRKHHYVPQVHIKRFEHSDGYTVFIKDKKKLISKKSSHDIFAIKDLNSSLDENGNIDHTSIELSLGEIWDNKFNSHLQSLLSWIKDSIEQNNYSKIPIEESLKFFFEYGLMGYMRSIRKKREFNDSIINSILELKELIPHIYEVDLSNLEFTKEQTEIGREGIKDFINLSTNLATEWQNKLKFPAPSAIELPMLIPDNLVGDIFVSKAPPFYLPDCTAIILKSEKTSEYQNRNINKIVSISLPLTQNVFIQIRNKDFFPSDSTDLFSIGKERTEEINNQLINYAFEQVLVAKEFKLQSI